MLQSEVTLFLEELDSSIEYYCFIFSSLWVLKRYLFFIHLFIYFLQKQGPNGKKTSALSTCTF